jgi:hypothetical protein
MSTKDLLSYPAFRRIAEHELPGLELPPRMRPKDWIEILNDAMRFLRMRRMTAWEREQVWWQI